MVLIEKILSFLSNHPRQIFDYLYWDHILGRYKLVSSTVDKTDPILWATLQSHEVMVEFSRNDIKRHPYIMSVCSRFLVTVNILEPLQVFSKMNRDIKVLRTKSDHNHARLANIKECGKPEGRLLGEPSKLAALW